MDVITTVLILLEAIFVLAWMDMSWNQIITLVQVIFKQIIPLYFKVVAMYVLNRRDHYSKKY